MTNRRRRRKVGPGDRPEHRKATSNEDDPLFVAKPALKVKGGIRAQSRRGDFAGTWWGKRWIATLEASPVAGRLTRGRSYARDGQVADLRIVKGEVTAKVQGSRRAAYRVTMRLKQLSDGQWNAVCDLLLRQPIYTARLLGNEMPEDIEAVFGSLGLSLFPGPKHDFTTECSCPDWSNPCKHIAAVHYLLAEALDMDPFLLFRLRGMEHEELLAALQKNSAGQGLAAAPAAAAPERVELPVDPEFFWSSELPLPESAEAPVKPAMSAAFPKRLGPLPFWRSERPFLEAMEGVYKNTSALALACLISEEEQETE
ncbi:MAG: SWIM zinc finger family protein [Ignavibacteria bacterium]|nr:SWIM zinc finger family protein [Ignavibacteria bacterium]